MPEEMIDIVDDDDKLIGRVLWKEMHDKKLTHRSSNIFVFNSKGELYVHKRNNKLPLYPGKYDVKFGGILKAGESYEDGAKRELKEEAGIDCELEFMFNFKFRSKENNGNRKVYKCVFDGKMTLDKAEVEAGEFMSIDDAKNMMDSGKLSEGAASVFREYLKQI